MLPLYIWIIMLRTLSLHIFKNISQFQTSLKEYFRFSFRCIYSIYIHSWAHTWHPFRRVFPLIAWKECLKELMHILHTTSGAVCWTLKGFCPVLVGVRTFPKITSFFTHFNYWKLSTDPLPCGTGKTITTNSFEHTSCFSV